MEEVYYSLNIGGEKDSVKKKLSTLLKEAEENRKQSDGEEGYLFQGNLERTPGTIELIEIEDDKLQISGDTPDGNHFFLSTEIPLEIIIEFISIYSKKLNKMKAMLEAIK